MQILLTFLETKSGLPRKTITVKTVYAAQNISTATYHAWKRKYAGMEVSEARKLRAMEEEYGRLKRLVADRSVQNQILKEVNAKRIGGKKGSRSARSNGA